MVVAVLAVTGGVHGLVAAEASGEPYTLAGQAVVWFADGWLATAPYVNLIVALLAVGLAPVATHGPRTLATIQRVIAVSLVALAVSHPAALAVVWILSILLVGTELARSVGGEGGFVARLFWRYHGASALAVVVGSAALATGNVAVGVAAWLLGVAIREAIVPLHGWLPAMAARAPLGLVVALVAPQIGVYAQIVLADVTPAPMGFAFACAGAITAVLAAAIGLVQDDARRASAWLLVSQTGLVAVGLESQSSSGTAGGMLTWQVTALALSGFVMTVAALEARRGPLSLRRYGGSFARTPRMAVAFLVLGFASVALPLTLGFVAEDLLMQGSVHRYPALGFAVIIATALNGMNVMRCFFVLFSGTRMHAGEADLTRLETGALTVAMVILFVGGVVPALLVGR